MKSTRNCCCSGATKPSLRALLRQRQAPLITGPIAALCVLVSVVFFSVGWNIAGAANQRRFGSWEDDVAALRSLRDSSEELTLYFGDAEDPSKWTGVTVTDGRLTGLSLEKCSSMLGLPDAVGSVEELDGLAWCASLAALPDTLTKLKALSELNFYNPSNDIPKPAPETPPTTFPCFAATRPSDTPSSLCPEPRMRGGRQRNLRKGGGRRNGQHAPVHGKSW